MLHQAKLERTAFRLLMISQTQLKKLQPWSFWAPALSDLLDYEGDLKNRPKQIMIVIEYHSMTAARSKI